MAGTLDGKNYTYSDNGGDSWMTEAEYKEKTSGNRHQDEFNKRNLATLESTSGNSSGGETLAQKFARYKEMELSTENGMAAMFIIRAVW